MLNLKENDRQKVYFTSDWHWNHQQEFIWKSRGHNSVAEHNATIIEETNKLVGPNDILFHAGDLMLNSKPENFETLISQINCKTIYMLFGNHPNPHYRSVYLPMVKAILGDKYETESEVYPLRYKNIIYIGHHLEFLVNGQYIVLNHYPLSVWNEMARGGWMLCGHSHYGFPQSKADSLYGKILDVGWDGIKRPWSFTEIKELFSTKRFVAHDAHHK